MRESRSVPTAGTANGVGTPGGALAAGAPAPRSEGPPELRIRGIWELAWPTIIGNLLMSMTGIVDLKIVGSLGPSAIAAVGAGGRIFFAAQAVMIGVTAGTAALVARAWGAGDRQEADQVTRASFGLCAAIGAVLAIAGMLFADVLALAFRIDADAIAFASSYIGILAAFNVFFAITFALSSALRATGDVTTPLVVGVLANVLNVVLDYGLVFGELGMPRLGVAGAALASGLSMAIAGALLVVLWMRGRLNVGTGARGALVPKRVRALLRVGYPAAIEQGLWQGGFVAFLYVVGLYGTAPFAAYNIGVQLLSFSFVIGFGFSIAGSTLVGQHLGARDPASATASGWGAMRMSILAMLVFGALVVAAAEPLARFMVSDPEVVRLTVFFIFVLGAVQPLMAVEFSLGGALRGAGDTRSPLVSTFAGLIVVRIGGAMLLATIGLPVEWIFAVLIADYVVKSTFLTLRFRSGRWQTALAPA